MPSIGQNLQSLTGNGDVSKLVGQKNTNKPILSEGLIFEQINLFKARDVIPIVVIINHCNLVVYRVIKGTLNLELM